MKREYLRVLEGRINDNILKELGEKGWELVGISIGEYPTHNVLYFKRVLNE